MRHTVTSLALKSLLAHVCLNSAVLAARFAFSRRRTGRHARATFSLSKNANLIGVAPVATTTSTLRRGASIIRHFLELPLSNPGFEAHLTGPPARKEGLRCLRDARPDYWARRVIEKHAGKATLGDMDYGRIPEVICATFIFLAKLRPSLLEERCL